MSTPAAPTAPTARRRFHRPSRISLLITMASVALMCALGTWQVKRLAWKEGLLAKIETRATGAAIPLPEHIPDPDALDYQRVMVSGIYFHEMSLQIVPRTLDGQVGAHVITPLQMPSGAVVLVNRGFVPNGWTPRELDNPKGLTTFSGIARVPEEAGMFSPENDPEKGGWYWVDRAAIAEHLGLDNALPVIVYASKLANPGAYPIGGQARMNLPNDHLQYAIFWYGMALAMGLVFILYHYRRDAEARHA